MVEVFVLGLALCLLLSARYSLLDIPRIDLRVPAIPRMYPESPARRVPVTRQARRLGLPGFQEDKEAAPVGRHGTISPCAEEISMLPTIVMMSASFKYLGTS